MAVYSPLSDGCLSFEYDILDMVPHIDRDKIRGFIPLRLSRHLIVDVVSVDLETLEKDVLHLALLVVAVDDGHVGLLAIVADVAEGNVFYTLAWCGAVFLVVAHLYLQYASLMDIFYSDVVEHHIFDIVVVATVYCHATLIVNLRFTLTKDVYIFVSQSDDAIANLRVAMDADEDWMGNVCPEGGIPHLYISHRTVETLSCGIGCGTIV